jgi:hypothetical protein
MRFFVFAAAKTNEAFSFSLTDNSLQLNILGEALETVRGRRTLTQRGIIQI